ncbi:MAG: DUF177 domain-containing protein [Chromatiales bacterium]|nr:MAG: DUF177 domain-containing protein [Chromatiales bacterium]
MRQATWTGQLGRSELPRLASLLAEGAAPALEATVRFAPVESGLAQINLSLRGHVQLVCQRCLGPLDWAVALDVSLTVVADESDTGRLEDPFESVVLPADGLHLDQLAEDEVLAAVPLAPRHGPDAACSGPAQLGADERDEPGGASRPFADLAAMLKTGQRRSD